MAAATRRLQEELGFVSPLKTAFTFTYKAPFDNGLTEYEFDHVLTSQYDGLIQPNPEEVCEIAYKSMDAIRAELDNSPEKYTAWFRIAFPRLEELLA
jgi:isopentenyl-diphosphate delta-isomerase